MKRFWYKIDPALSKFKTGYQWNQNLGKGDFRPFFKF